MIDVEKLKLDVEHTIRAWQDEESEFNRIDVDEGNIANFIKEVNDTISTNINLPEPTQISYKEEYYKLKKVCDELKEANSKLTEALVNLALKLK